MAERFATVQRMSLINLHGDLIVLPKSLYEFMPYLYIVIGAVAALALYNSYAIISGVLFLAVALVIFYMRLKSRTEKLDRYERLYVEEKKKSRNRMRLWQRKRRLKISYELKHPRQTRYHRSTPAHLSRRLGDGALIASLVATSFAAGGASPYPWLVTDHCSFGARCTIAAGAGLGRHLGRSL